MYVYITHAVYKITVAHTLAKDMSSVLYVCV